MYLHYIDITTTCFGFGISHHQVVILALVIHEMASSLGQCALWYRGGGGGARDLVFVSEAKGKYMGKCCCLYVGLVLGCARLKISSTPILEDDSP